MRGSNSAFLTDLLKPISPQVITIIATKMKGMTIRPAVEVKSGATGA